MQIYMIFIGHVSNIHVSLRNDISNTLFSFIQQNKIIMVVLVIAIQRHTDIINVLLIIIQQVQLIKDMVHLKKKKKLFTLFKIC